MTDTTQTHIPVVPVGNVPAELFDGHSALQKIPDTVRIVHISDTHMQHEELMNGRLLSTLLPDGEVLIHSGNFDRYTASCCVRSHHFEDFLHEVRSTSN